MAAGYFVAGSVSIEHDLYYVLPLPLSEHFQEPTTQEEPRFFYLENSDRSASVEPVREFNIGAISSNDKLRFGQSAGLVKIHSDHAVENHSFLFREPNELVTSFTIVLTLDHNTMFNLAGVQANLWLGAYAEFYYQGFMGELDKKFLEAARNRELEAGDAFAVEVVPSEELRGVVVLAKSLVSGTREATLHVAGYSDDLNSKCLRSVHTIEIDGIVATFRRKLGQVSGCQMIARTNGSSERMRSSPRKKSCDGV